MLNPLSFVSRRRRWFYPLVSAVVALSLVLSSAFVPAQAIPWDRLIFQGIQVLQLSNISDKQEVAIGKQINDQLVGNQFQLYRNRKIAEYVDQIGQRLAAASDRPNLPYTFQVVRDDNVNAFATMGGFVYVTTGLLATADNEAQLASVIGHEIGHIASRHSIEQMRQVALQRGLATAAGLDTNRIVQLGAELAFNRPSSRKDELEADRRGLRTMEKAGYPPSAMVGFMEKLLDRSSPPSFLSTHPATQDRITAIERTVSPSTGGNAGYGLDENAYKAVMRSLLSTSRY